MNLRTLFLTGTGLFLFVALLPARAETNTITSEQVPNNGDDFTRPPTSFDLRYQYQDKPGGVSRDMLIMRVNSSTRLADDWKLATRFDLPFVCSDASGSDNPTGAYKLGVGDLLLQGVLVRDISKRWAVGIGPRLTLPTATQDSLGSGKIKLGPIAGIRYFVPEISRGSYAQLVVRYECSVGGDPSRGPVSTLFWSPTVSFALPDDWFFILYPSQEISINLQNDNKWFVPIDVAFGKNLTRTQLVSLEISQAVLKQYTPYNFKLEARWSVYF